MPILGVPRTCNLNVHRIVHTGIITKLPGSGVLCDNITELKMTELIIKGMELGRNSK